MLGIGYVLITASVILGLRALVIDPSVPIGAGLQGLAKMDPSVSIGLAARVFNLALADQRMILLGTAGALFLAGTMFVVGAYLINAIDIAVAQMRDLERSPAAARLETAPPSGAQPQSNQPSQSRTLRHELHAAREHKLASLKAQAEGGQITSADYELSLALARLEAQNESGEITDTEYEQAVTDLKRSRSRGGQPFDPSIAASWVTRDDGALTSEAIKLLTKAAKLGYAIALENGGKITIVSRDGATMLCVSEADILRFGRYMK